ncbi:MAG: prolipoprotein diacylglyceryl transferase [Acidobacteria bacterium]|nr:MAG: prolipoprotein diacylglyceryl transferase [Acidobacteriota bacterium]
MIRELFHIGPVSISPFGVMMALAFLASYGFLRWGLKRQGIGDEEDAGAIMLAAGFGGIAGAKIYYAILYSDWRLLFQRTGLVWYGGFILATLVVYWVGTRRGLPVRATADVIAPSLALGYAVGRIGCFLVGDDYGMPTDLPWGVRFPYGLPGPTTAGFMRAEYQAQVPDVFPDHQLIPVHPTQLYETLACLGICLFGVWLLRRGIRPGSTALVVFGLLAVERFLVEFVRAKDDHFFGALTLAQLLSLAVLVFLVIVWMKWRADDRRAGQAGE